MIFQANFLRHSGIGIDMCIIINKPIITIQNNIYSDGALSCLGYRSYEPRKVSVINFKFSLSYKYEITRSIIKSKIKTITQPVGSLSNNLVDLMNLEEKHKVSFLVSFNYTKVQYIIWTI